MIDRWRYEDNLRWAPSKDGEDCWRRLAQKIIFSNFITLCHEFAASYKRVVCCGSKKQGGTGIFITAKKQKFLMYAFAPLRRT